MKIDLTSISVSILIAGLATLTLILFLWTQLYMELAHGYSEAQRHEGGYYLGDYKFMKNNTIYKHGLMVSVPAVYTTLIIVFSLIGTIGYGIYRKL